jgi:PAS domain S-box-containing protein
MRGGRLAYVNDSACRSTGYTRDELLSMTVGDLDQNYPAETWQQVWEKLVRTGSGRLESMHRRKDASLFPVEINLSYLSYDEFAYACAFARDITEQKKAEQALHENVERWQSVESQNVKAVRILAGDVAHYFNNLLSAIMGYASLLQMKMDKHGPLYSYAAHILTSSERAVNLTQSMLAFSQKQAPDLKPAALNDTVKKLHELLEGLIPKDNELRVETNENAPLFAMQTEDRRDISRIIGGIETILIAGENKDVRQLLTRVLREHGYSVFTAMDGSAAIEMFRQHSSDIPLVILDIDMPKMNGKEAYEAIRRIEPSTKIIFTAEHGYDMVNNKGTEQYDVLIKPLNPTKLLKKIREVLDRKP